MARESQRARSRVLIAIALGGAIGSAARYGVAGLLTLGPGAFPWATLVVNITGGFALGLVVAGVAAARSNPSYAQAFWGVGVLGGFTTFSTLTVELRDLVASGRGVIAVGYLALTLVGGLGAVRLGLMAGRRAPRALP